MRCKGKGAKAGSDGFGEMQDGDLCSSSAPGTKQACAQ